MPYPRKQTLLIFTICAIIVGSAAWNVYGPFWQNWSGTKTVSFNTAVSGGVNTNTPASANNTAQENQLPKNSDWQSEFLQKGNSSNKSAAFNTAAAAESADSSDDSDNAPLTPTDMLGREFFSDYMQLHQAGLDTDPASVNNMTNQLVSDSMQNVQAPKTYGLSDLHVAQTFTNASLETYGNSIVAILGTYVPDENHNEAVIADQVLDGTDGSDTSGLSALDPIISNYQAALSTLLSMSVPKPLAAYHLDLVNGVAIGLSNAEALRMVGSDPVSSLAALGLEETELDSLDTGITSIRQYFSDSGLPFNG